VSWFNLNENASYPRPAHWILVLTEVFLRHPVYVFLRSIECHLTDASADCGRVVGGGWIADVERDFGVPDSVSVLEASLVGVDDDDVSLMVNPRLSDVRRAVWHERGKVRVAPRVNKFLDGVWKRFQFTLRNRLLFVNISALLQVNATKEPPLCFPTTVRLSDLLGSSTA